MAFEEPCFASLTGSVCLDLGGGVQKWPGYYNIIKMFTNLWYEWYAYLW